MNSIGVWISVLRTLLSCPPTKINCVGIHVLMALAGLKATLRDIVVNDINYDMRDALIFSAMALARVEGIDTWMQVDDQTGELFCYMQLPTGQVRWMIKNKSTSWDGHSNSEKLDRCMRFAESEI